MSCEEEDISVCPNCCADVPDEKLELSFDHYLVNYTRNIKDYMYVCHKFHMKRDRKGDKS